MNKAKWTINYFLADQDMVLHSLKSGRVKYGGDPQGSKSGPARSDSFRRLCMTQIESASNSANDR